MIQQRFEQEEISIALPAQELRIQSVSNGTIPQQDVNDSQPFVKQKS
jgi:hypothetical protein